MSPDVHMATPSATGLTCIHPLCGRPVGRRWTAAGTFWVHVAAPRPKPAPQPLLDALRALGGDGWWRAPDGLTYTTETLAEALRERMP